MTTTTSHELLKATEDMLHEFSDRIRELEALAVLLNHGASPEDLRAFSSALTQAEKRYEELNETVEIDRTAVAESVRIVEKLKALKIRASALDARIPRELKMAKVVVVEEEEVVEAVRRGDGENVACVTVPSVKQFEAVPRYMRGGGVTYEDVTKVCEALNRAAEYKKGVLAAVPGPLGANVKTLKAQWKAQDEEEVQGFTFVTDDDLELNLKLSSSTALKSALQCLRHVGVLRVSPYQNMNRYVFLQ